MFGKKKIKKCAKTEAFDREAFQPVIRASICTGERVAGFKEIRTGKFTEDMLIRSGKDMEAFLEKYGLSEAEIRKEW